MFPFLKEVVEGETTDLYFKNTKHILTMMRLNPDVGIKIFSREAGIFCGISQIQQLLQGFKGSVWSMAEGDYMRSGESALQIRCKYLDFCTHETAILGILASSTGWATAANDVVLSANSKPVFSYGARHVHPNVASIMDYCSIVGGCTSCSTPAGAALANTSAAGTMPHALILVLSSMFHEKDCTTRAVREFNNYMDPKIPTIALVDTFGDEVQEAKDLASKLGGAIQRLDGFRLDTASERGGVTIGLVKELRAKLDLDFSGNNLKIVVSGGFTPEKIRAFENSGAPVDSYGVGSYIAHASPIDFTADIREIDGYPVAKRGRIPGMFKDNPKLQCINMQ